VAREMSLKMCCPDAANSPYVFTPSLQLTGTQRCSAPVFAQDLRTCCALDIVLGVVVVLMVPMLGV
jgi:hypothetical protein